MVKFKVAATTLSLFLTVSAYSKQKLLDIEVSLTGLSELYVNSVHYETPDSENGTFNKITDFEYVNEQYGITRDFAPAGDEAVLMTSDDTGGVVGTDIFKISFSSPVHRAKDQTDIYPFKLEFRSNLLLARVFRRLQAQLEKKKNGANWVPIYRGTKFDKMFIKIDVRGIITRLELSYRGHWVRTVKVGKLPEISINEF